MRCKGDAHTQARGGRAPSATHLKGVCSDSPRLHCSIASRRLGLSASPMCFLLFSDLPLRGHVTWPLQRKGEGAGGEGGLQLVSGRPPGENESMRGGGGRGWERSWMG